MSPTSLGNLSKLGFMEVPLILTQVLATLASDSFYNKDVFKIVIDWGWRWAIPILSIPLDHKL